MFEEKRQESLQLAIELCLETYDEMHSTPVGMEKLEKSYKALLDSLSYQLKNHPFRKLPVYRGDFERLRNLIENTGKENGKSPYELYIGLSSLQKKIKMHTLSSQYVECLRKELPFREIDVLLEALVSDLLFMGYSLNYLNEWYVAIKDEKFYAALENKDLTVFIEKLNELKGERQTYEVVIPYRVKSESQKELAHQLLVKHFTIKQLEDFSGFQQGQGWIWKENTYACKEYAATDYYKAIELAKNEFTTDKELFAMWQNVNDIIKESRQIGCLIQGELFTLDIRKVDNTKLISYFDKNREKQLLRFLELKDNMRNEDVDTLDRILHTLHTAKEYNIQNRFLNFWSALEYSIYPFPKKSIIEKARTIVAESFTLFYVKNKMNIFWERLNFTMGKKESDVKYPNCRDFLEQCKDGEDGDFDTKKMIFYFQSEDRYKDMLEEINFHIVLEREMRELIMLVTEPKKLKKAVEEYHESVVHDLDCIYRLRNRLVHSAKSQNSSLEHISLRLYRYVNSIVATILYYKKRNAEISIIEILNSLHNTYEIYMEQLGRYKKEELSVEEGYNIVRPKYLFLE